MENRVTYTVYYEDTDSLGVVYYANYLKYLERGRTELVGQFGRPIREWNADGYYFVVYGMTIKFRRPAELSDHVDVVSAMTLESPFRALFHQRIERAGATLVEADVEVVCLGRNRAIQEFPAELRPGS
ncbi:MAG TPA: YbgC/FadM family acyl-CoA thioesterase [Kouleothrix sp.]|uniref:YbgC/FadM family acyl-CoA thioesterase n=1 Tax=Kouleothrix sp. TaxID=2779161 RepID=UPI002B9F278B|nr:YbgC/FadM family acyl-CoA thioesterase [Kouleothrix sp.]HRC76733.1 YbgC/FadM family acyl-CoA thioesterase [Kouleothrix sp.]